MLQRMRHLAGRFGEPSSDRSSPAPSRRLYGLHMLNGWVVVGGVLCVTVLGSLLFGRQAGIVAMTGGLCASIADVPSPTRHKAWELGIAALLVTLASFLGGLAVGNEVLLGIVVAALSFSAAMLTAYGRKAMPVSFSLLLALFLTLSVPLHGAHAVLRHSALMGCGALLYLVYGLIAARLVEHRVKRLAIGECLREFAAYLREKARCYQPDVALDAQYRVLVTRQIALTERLQLAREVVFRNRRNAADERLVGALRMLIDAAETILAMHSDYGWLRAHHRDDQLLDDITALVEALAAEVAGLATVLLRGRQDGEIPSYDAHIARIADVMHSLAVQRGDEQAARATLALRASFNKLRHGLSQVGALHRLLRDPAATASSSSSREFLHPFTQHFSFSPQVLLKQLTWTSPVFRHAVRLSMAVTTGYLLATFIPWGHHGNWIMLTIAVIMRPQFSLTRQRRTDRLLGNIFGCVIAAVLLRLLPAPALLIVILIAVGAAHAFATVQYRLTSTAACVMALLQLHFLAPGGGALFTERVADTALGAAIAYAFSFVLPYWESSFLPTQLGGLLTALANFARQALRLPADDAEYRLARKAMLDAITLFSAALQRARNEPVAKEAALDRLNDCAISAYLLASQLATMRFYERRMEQGQVLHAADRAILDATRERVLSLLQAGDTTRPEPADEVASPAVLPDNDHAALGPLLRQRLRYIEQEATTLATRARAVSAEELTVRG